MLLFQSCKENVFEETSYTDFSIYLTKDTLVRTGLNLNEVIKDKPLIDYDDIIAYDATRHIIYLKFQADTLFHYSKKYDGRGFVALLNHNIKVYCGVLWSPIHSSTNPNIVITLPMDNLPNSYRLEVLDNYHDSTLNSGYALINDKRIIDLFKKDGKLR